MKREIYFDDLDESPDAQPITFALEGKEYQIDLSEKNAERLRSALQEFIGKARPVVPRPVTSLASERTSRRRSSGSGRDDIQAIRQWANDNGYELPPRGRIKQSVIDAYDEAHK
jgi:hypothetical protein